LILVVDDEVSTLAVAQQTLEALGYDVLTAQGATEAIAVSAARPSAVALIITDMMMARGDGAERIAALRRSSAEVPIIATSGNRSDHWILRARAVGAQHILAKPYAAPLLLRMVAGILMTARGLAES
jgi:two-component system cell cycle sensor histidine kinase/response regulator CckA